jgi:uncharacterized membrane protein
VSSTPGEAASRPGGASEEHLAELPPAARENLELLEHVGDTDRTRPARMQLAIERVSDFFGSPAYFVFVVAFSAAWILYNSIAAHAGAHPIDPPPFSWLQGVVSFNALLLTIAVLIRQNRMALLAEHRSHLDLQINLLTEQKVAKVVEIVDGLRREVLRVRGRSHEVDEQVEELEELAKPADPHALLNAIKQQTGDS